jgi:hypothetical protein
MLQAFDLLHLDGNSDWRASSPNASVRPTSPGADVRRGSSGIELRLDLSSGTGSGNWTLPDGTAQTPTFELQHIKTVSRPEGTMLLFAGETSSDDGAYSLALLLI